MTESDQVQSPVILPWQTLLWQQVVTAYRSQHLAHALLVSGPNGVGKRHFAQRLIGMLLCQRHDERVCGECSGCRQLKGGGHPGFMRLTREEGRRDISIDAVRAMCSALAMTSHDGGIKVALLDPVDALNQSGVNALLKTLEEPSGGVLILISERPLSLPATLRSRCQVLRVPIPTTGVASQWLAVECPDESAIERESALKLSRGAPLRAVEFLKNPDRMKMTAVWEAMLLSLLDGRNDPIDAASRIDADQVVAFLEWLAGWVRDALCNPGDIGIGRRPLAQLGQGAFDAMRLIKSNVKPQLVVEALLIEVSRATSTNAVPRRSTRLMDGGL